jgi:hypothetical protein
MSTHQGARSRTAESEHALELAIVRQVMQRTGRPIQAFEVKVSQNAVVIRGRAPSCYVEQLPPQGVLDLVDCASGKRIELNILVSGPSGLVGWG